jgi:predicted Fe-Mo cluster-binding NifX family protein
MKIAITAETNNGMESLVAHHFGHAPFFILVDVDDCTVKSVQSVANPFINGHAPGQVPEFIKSHNADVMLSGGMGGRAIQFFNQVGIEVATGAQGTVQQAMESYLGGSLEGAAPCDESVAHGHGD